MNSSTHQPRLDPSRMDNRGGSWLVVGLGNPGAEYEKTRHNCGYMVADRFVEGTEGKYRTKKLGSGAALATVADIRLGYGMEAPRVILAHTGTYMNDSGPAVRELMKFYKIGIDHLLVIHDDMDLNFRSAKLKVGGSDGGHNGLKSIQRSLESNSYARLRIGVGHPLKRESGGDVINWVLGRFPKSQAEELEEVLNRAVQCVHDVVEIGLAKAQARLHAGNP